METAQARAEAAVEAPDTAGSGSPGAIDGGEGGEQQHAGLGPRHRRVAALLTQLASTARSFLLYDAHNAAIQRFVTALLAAFLSLLGDEGEIELDVQPFEMRFAGEPVYANRDRERSLAFRLYRDGVRALKLRNGFDWEELAKLLEILSIRYTGVHQQEDDVVTLLWKANFQHLDVVAVEGFVPEASEAFAEAARVDGTGLPDDVDQPMPRPLQAIAPSWVQVGDEAREVLRAEAAALALPEDCLQLLRRLRPLLNEPAAGATLSELAHLFGEVRDFLLSDGSLASLARLIGILRELAAGEAPAWDPDRRAVASELLRHCADERAVRRLIHSVPADERTPQPELVEILDGACPDPLAAVAAAHAAEAGPGARSVARQLLARYAAGRLEVLRGRFEKARGHVAQDLLRVIAQAGREAEALFCARQTSHPDAEVREEAIHCLESMRYSASMGRGLFEAFRGSTGACRSRVLALLERSGDRRFVDHLAEFLEREAGRLGAEEASEIGRVLGRLGGAGAAGRWQAWLKPGGMLRRLQGPLAVQVAAATALGEIPGEGPAQALRAALVAAGPEARHWIGQALAQRARGPAGKAAP